MKETAIIGLICVSLLVSAPSGATTVLHQSFPALVQQADTIVVGTVAAMTAEWEATRERPYTFITFTDLDVRKGPASETVTLQMLGGPEPDGNILTLSGVPAFHPGDRFLLFLTGNGPLAVPRVGLGQGAYRVVFDPDRDAAVVYTHTMQPLTALPAKRSGVVFDRLSTPGGASAAPLALAPLLQALAREGPHD